jgi:tRNA dimethylallyltransferase
MLGITFEDRQLLYDRIRRRVDLMLENGLLEEAEATLNLKGGGVQAIGHKELHKYFKGELSLEEAVELLKRESCHYAKRQLTWFKKDTRINWIYADKTDDVLSEAKRILKEAGNQSER